MLLPLLSNNLDTPAAIPPVLIGTFPGLRERQDTGSHQLDSNVYFSGATSYSISPAVETGWSFDTGTGLLSFDTDVVGTYGPYVITATNANGSTDSNAFSVEVYAFSVVQGGSAKRRQRKRYLVEIDKQYFEVDSVAEAESLLLKALKLATEAAEQATDRAVKRIKRGKQATQPSVPIVSTPNDELRSLVDGYRQDIEAIYRQIAVDAQIRELMRLRMMEEDEEDSIAALLLH